MTVPGTESVEMLPLPQLLLKFTSSWLFPTHTDVAVEKPTLCPLPQPHT